MGKTLDKSVSSRVYMQLRAMQLRLVGHLHQMYRGEAAEVRQVTHHRLNRRDPTVVKGAPPC
jgi:hypothetical protein